MSTQKASEIEQILHSTEKTEPVVNRRDFMKGSGAAAAGLAAMASSTGRAASLPYSDDYGPLSVKPCNATGLNLLALPDGFEYISYGWTGQRQTDGTYTARGHDGMGVVAARGNTICLVRNHELSGSNGLSSKPANGAGVYSHAHNGGTSSLLFDVVNGKFLSAWNSLGGTIRNCSGGLTPWGTWLSCEETFHSWRADDYNHGYVFEVPGFGISDGQPIREMGRFSHEAAAVDPATGFVYETEDSGASAFYKFEPSGEWGDLKSGGKLYAMVVDNTPRVDLRGGLAHGTTWSVSWQEVPDPDAQTQSCYDQATDAAIIERGEGCFYDHGKIYFCSTSGGAANRGQIFVYDPRSETLTLMFESAGSSEVDGPDNICVSPRGSVLMCEDGGRNPKLCVGLSQTGNTFPFIENQVVLSAGDIDTVDAVYAGTKANFHSNPIGDYRGSEFAGGCFYDRWLFVNIQTPGITFAIKGPWENGAL